jgi:hypothetical protein
MESEDLLWRRVAALRGIALPNLGGRAHILGDRFAVQITRPRTARRKTPVREVGRVSLADSYQGVIGEIAVGNNPDRADEARAGSANDRAQPPPTALGWHRALIEREAERLARLQPERRSR